MHPLEIASFLIQEDFVIMEEDSNERIYHANVNEQSNTNSYGKSKFISIFSRHYRSVFHRNGYQNRNLVYH